MGHQVALIHIMEVPEVEEVKGQRTDEEIMSKNISNPRKEIDIQFYEVQRTPNNMN